MNIRVAVVVLLLGFAGVNAQSAPLRVVATTPELADITRRIGGEHVKVESLARGTEDIHNVPQKPSFVPKLNQADAVVLIGMELEHAFLPALLEVAQNPRIRPGREGYIDCSQGLAPLEVPRTLSRSEGELHPFGNPHYTLDPRQGGRIADVIAAGLTRVDPQHKADYESGRLAFRRDWTAALANWQVLARPLKGVKAVSHHQDMTYLADFLGLEMIGTVELKPGIAPTPTHLQKLAGEMKSQNARLLIREFQYPGDTARWLQEQTGARMAVIATLGGAFPDTATYFGFLEHNLRAIADAAASL